MSAASPRRSGRLLLTPLAWSIAVLLLSGTAARASEADLAIPDLHAGTFTIFGQTISAWNLLLCGALVICGTLGISLYLRTQIHRLPAHKSMLDISEIIFQTCKTYLIQQGKFLLMLFVLIGSAISYYLWTSSQSAPPLQPGAPPPMSPFVTIALVLLFAVVGMGGSYWVAWYGIRVNTWANS